MGLYHVSQLSAYLLLIQGLVKIQGLRKIQREKVQNTFPEQNISVQIC